MFRGYLQVVRDNRCLENFFTCESDVNGTSVFRKESESLKRQLGSDTNHRPIISVHLIRSLTD